MIPVNNNGPNQQPQNQPPLPPGPQVPAPGEYGSRSFSVVPIGFFFYGITISIFFLIGLITPEYEVLADVPIKVLQLQIWRPLFCFFVSPDIFSYIMTLLALYSMSLGEENKVGSARYILQFFYRSIFIQLLFVLVGLVFKIIFSINAWSFGIWPTYICILTFRCLKEPEVESNFCYLGIMIKNKQLPVIYLLIFLPFSFYYGIQLDLYCATLLGYLMVYWPVVQSTVDPGEGSVRSFENWLYSLQIRIGTIVTEHQILAAQNEFQRSNLGTNQALNGMNAGGNYTSFGDNNYQGQQQTGVTATTNITTPEFPGQGVKIGGTNSRDFNPRKSAPYENGYPLPPATSNGTSGLIDSSRHQEPAAVAYK